MKKSNYGSIIFLAVIIAVIIFLILEFSHVYWLKDHSDLIGILEICVNIFLAIGVIIYFQKKNENQRHLKNYFIETVKDIQSDYYIFINDVLDGKLSSRDIINWFSKASQNLSELEKFIKEELNISDQTLGIQSRLLMQKITNSADFNDQFSNSNYLPEKTTKNDITLFHKTFRLKVLKKIVAINGA